MAICWEDSYSDGMCGWVEMRDLTTGKKERVHWSVTHPTIQSQHEAANEARRRLREGSEGL